MSRPHTAGDLLASRYRLVREIGAGGMGVVWEAVDTGSGTHVAVKLLNESEDAVRRRRFLREASTAAAVRHPNVVRIHDAQVDASGAPLLVMDLLEGESLGSRLSREGRLDLASTAAILLQVISAVATAHALGIVHRDLKPENVFITSGGLPVVLDFGIAKLTAPRADVAPSASLTAEGIVVGTPAYMAPEQIFGDRDVDHRVDVWALGLLLYQCLSGTLPTAGAHVGEILKKLLSATIAPLRSRAPDVPDDVARVVDAMLARNRVDRPTLARAAGVLGGYTDMIAPPFGPPAVVALESEDDHAPTLDATSPPRSYGESLRATGRPPRARSPLGAATTVTSELASERRADGPSALRRRRWAVAAAMVAGTSVLAAVALQRTRARPTAAAAGAALLTPRDAKLACPPLRAAGVEGDPGWLGAAAASLACADARWLLGGAPSRSIGPADLLDLPHQPTGDFPVDPFAGDARERAVNRARARAQAWVDGSVTRERDVFRVELALRSSGADEGSTRGVPVRAEDERLDRAVRAGVHALAARGELPNLPVEADVRSWTSIASADVAFALDDAATSVREYDVDPPCAEVNVVRHALGRPLPFPAPACGEDGGAPAVDRSSLQAIAATLPAAATGLTDADAADLARELAAARASEPSRVGRSALALAQAAVTERSGAKDARLILLDALRDDPTSADVWSAFGHASLDEARGSPAWMGLERAIVAWRPADPSFWATCGGVWTPDMLERVRCAQRAHDLAPLDGNYTVQLGRALLAANRTEETRALAAASLSRGGEDARVGQFLLARIDLDEVKFGSALERLRLSTRETQVYDSRPWVSAYTIGMLLTLGEVLGRAEEVADEWIERFLLAVPSRVRTPVVERGELLLISACVRAAPAVGLRCLDAVDALHREHAFPEWTHDETTYEVGARLALHGNAAGAVATWRPLVAHHGIRQWLLRSVFVATHEWDLLEAADRDLLLTGMYGGVSVALSRAARIAAERGQTDKAAELASKVLAAWGGADAEIPVLDEMRALARHGHRP